MTEIFTSDGLADLSALGLSPSDIEARRHFLGGSDATIVGHANPKEVNALWAFKRGGPPLDLSMELPAMLGLWTEAFNLAWTQRVLGIRILRRGERVTSAEIPWMAATLDGWTEDGRLVQAKHVNGFWKEKDLVDFYAAQVHHEMLVTGAREALLCVIYGNQKHVVHRVPFDPFFADALLEAERAFWSAVEEGREPHPVVVEPPPPPPSEMREVSMEGNNAFAVAAAEWMERRTAAKLFAATEDALKGMMEKDVRRIHGHGIEVVRDGRGRTIRELKKEAV